ncbi:MAG: hypothetical protein QG623_4, partial [Patescibacteria group bacterium]|nr:hypothetical protein [Patescibacteria group bacterium]
SVISAHGRILHEATVATINPGASAGQLGSINWSEVDLTSASAMVLVLLQNLGLTGGITPEIATALLTGIVAGTDRFSNQKTTPKIMELSAQLMSSGADHQLVTSSIGAATSGQNTSQVINTAASDAVTIPEQTVPKDQEISLDLHSPEPPLPSAPAAVQAPTQQVSPASSATNTAPMVNSSQPAITPQQTDPLNPPAVATQISHDDTPSIKQATSNQHSDKSSFNEALNAVLPQPVDVGQTVVPNDLLPPAPVPLSQQGSQAEAQTQTQTPVLESQDIVPSSTTSEADKILSEIDDIYSAQPFDPANNPRGDLGTSIVTPDEIEQPLPSSVLTVDTSVQQDQALSSNMSSATGTGVPSSADTEGLMGLPAIPEAKQETINSADILGTSPIANQTDSTAGQIPGIQMPPSIAPPPPPPLEAALPTFTPTIDFNDATKQ